MPANATDVDAIFCAAIELASPKERADYVARACGDDAELRRRVDELLAAHFEAGSFLESPAFASAETSDTQHLTPDTLAEGPGTVIGPYKLLQQIGEGGMGVVFMAEQNRPVQRTVALKIIKPGMDTRQVIARFEAERQALAMMDHPNIARVIDAGTTGEGVRDQVSGVSEDNSALPLTPDTRHLTPNFGRPYFVMDLVKGVPITEYCDAQRLSVRQRLELMATVCQAVQHAHQKGIIHRDLKPSNVLVAEYDGKPVPKIIDFGVAKATAQRLTERTMFTEYGQLIGTFEYMSPEQARFNQLDVDTRSDVYSLGVLLYELLAGSTPLEKERLRSAAFDEVLRIISEEDPPKPSTRLSSSEALPSIAANRSLEPKKLTGLVSGELDWIVMKCLEKDRSRRYETASSLAMDLQHYFNDEPVEARAVAQMYRLKKFIRRNKVGVLAGSAIVAAVLIGLIIASIGLVQARHQAEIARTEAARSAEVASFLKDMLAAAGPSIARGRDATLLREILDKTAERVDKDLKHQPEVQGDLWFTIGMTFSDIKDFERAATLFQHAVDNFRLAPGGDNAKLALALASLGRCQSFSGKVADGMSNARLGLDMARRHGDPETLAVCLISMGKACNFYGLGADESVPYFREAVDVYRKLSNNPVALADCLPSIATSDTEAIALWREALALHRQHLGPDHPKVASNLDSLGQVLLAHGDYEEAERVLRETVALYRKIHDPSYPYQRSTRRTLAAAIVLQKKFYAAEEVARDVPYSPDGVDWDLLGRVNAYRGRWPAAAAQLVRALETNPGMDKYRAGVALLAAGQDEPYRQLRRRFFDNYSTEVFPDAARALAFLLLQVDDEERARLEQLVESSYYTKMGPLVASRGRLDKALAFYRLGRFQPALDAATPAVVDAARLPNQAQAWYIQALAGARLQRLESARTALAEGDKLLAEPERNIHGDFLEDSFDWRIAEFLRAEAAKLLGITEPKPARPSVEPTEHDAPTKNSAPTTDD